MVDAVTWRDPVDRDPGSNERVPRVWMGQSTGRVRRVDHRGRRQGREHGRERCELIGGRGVSDVVGARQMGRHAGQPEPRSVPHDDLRELERVRRGDPDAAHPGVDLEMDVEAVEPVDVERGQGLDVGTCVDRRRQAMFDDARHVGDRLLAQQQDRRVDLRPAQLDSFVDEGDAQPLGPRGERRSRHIDRAVTVTVGLHHGPDRRRRHRAAQHLDVVPDRVVIDLRPRPPAHRPPSIETRVSPVLRARRGGVRAGHWRRIPEAARTTPPRRAARLRPRPR